MREGSAVSEFDLSHAVVHFSFICLLLNFPKASLYLLLGQVFFFLSFFFLSSVQLFDLPLMLFISSHHCLFFSRPHLKRP